MSAADPAISVAARPRSSAGTRAEARRHAEVGPLSARRRRSAASTACPALVGRLLRGRAGRDARRHRRQRLRQVDAPEAARRDPAADARPSRSRAGSRRCSSSAPDSTPRSRAARTSRSRASCSGLTRRRSRRASTTIVRFAGVEEFLDAPVKTYSSGMAVRLGFAIAAPSDPDVFLVDEVLAVGDEAFAHRALEKFSEFERAGKTLVFVSHDLALVAERCRRAHLARGRPRRRRRAGGRDGGALPRAAWRAEGERRLAARAPAGADRLRRRDDRERARARRRGPPRRPPARGRGRRRSR